MIKNYYYDKSFNKDEFYKTLGEGSKLYLLVKENSIVFGIGPAGTGKTALEIHPPQ